MKKKWCRIWSKYLIRFKKNKSRFNLVQLNGIYLKKKKKKEPNGFPSNFITVTRLEFFFFSHYLTYFVNVHIKNNSVDLKFLNMTYINCMAKQLYFPFLCMQQLTSYLIHWAIPEKNDLYTDIDNNDHIYVYIYMMYIYSIFTWKLA